MSIAKPLDQNGQDAYFNLARRLLIQGIRFLFGPDPKPEQDSLQYHKIRVYPCRVLMTHPFEPGLMKWQ